MVAAGVKKRRRAHHVRGANFANTLKMAYKRKARRKPQESSALAETWDPKKTVSQNMSQAGILMHPRDFSAKSGKKVGETSTVAKMEKEAEESERTFKDTHMMARDPHNHYQETASQIRKKIIQFKKSPQFAAYEKVKK